MKQTRKGDIMLTKNKASKDIDYLKDWPARYYDIPTGTLRMKYLKMAQENNLAVEADHYREKLCKKRFFAQNSTGNVDGFLHAWTMIKASSVAGVSFFQKKRLIRELESYLRDFCLLDYEPENETEASVLTAEWSDFARYFISSCVGSKSYCSTLFGFVPIKDSTVAEKIAAEIDVVTKEYPAKLGYEEAFVPLRNIIKDTYREMIEVE